MDLQLNGKIALVTGSTAGIGLAIAKRLVAEGATVVICGRNQQKLDAAIGETGARGVLADPATADGAAALVAAVPDVDILINNLGIYESKPFEEISDEDWRRFFEVNVLSGARLARSYFPGMIARDWGRVIFVASESGLLVPPDMVHYGMTKTAQLAIARGLAANTRGTRVTVNSVLPGTTRSEGIVDFLRSVADDPNAPEAELERGFFARERPTSLIQRMIEPVEVASLVAYVASPLSAATNGAALRVDGGITPTIV
ncbi:MULTISPECIES: SDR family oxidoreductase [Bradyrhizobium]|jgi:NAD(P)-dependent dehydrogenase (short-subunit alcohol dehydrogenase family)|nr:MULTISPECIES: SDR family oxidoreductase [Bradyrhizobium]KIU43318.1 oxidoreductase [Bradyrhizobium elkanii]MBK5650629.1 SDR family oxidoreductase [Rhizobium sp.]OCX29848.1 oxidoreductase [Bradyrhizobium sp. UASWS1016]